MVALIGEVRVMVGGWFGLPGFSWRRPRGLLLRVRM